MSPLPTRSVLPPVLLPSEQGMRAESWEHSLGSPPDHQEDTLLLEGDLGMGVVPIIVCGLPTIHSLLSVWGRVSEV